MSLDFARHDGDSPTIESGQVQSSYDAPLPAVLLTNEVTYIAGQIQSAFQPTLEILSLRMEDVLPTGMSEAEVRHEIIALIGPFVINVPMRTLQKTIQEHLIKALQHMAKRSLQQESLRHEMRSLFAEFVRKAS